MANWFAVLERVQTHESVPSQSSQEVESESSSMRVGVHRCESESTRVLSPSPSPQGVSPSPRNLGLSPDSSHDQCSLLKIFRLGQFSNVISITQNINAKKNNNASCGARAVNVQISVGSSQLLWHEAFVVLTDPVPSTNYHNGNNNMQSIV